MTIVALKPAVLMRHSRALLRGNAPEPTPLAEKVESENPLEQKRRNRWYFLPPTSKRGDDPDAEFRRLHLIPPKVAGQNDGRRPRRGFIARRRTEQWETMRTNQDWTSVWPTAASFRASVVPLPVRQSYRKKWWKDPPAHRYGNTELLKIPNFLHLGPPTVKRHCEAIKTGLATQADLLRYYPIKETTCDYVHDGVSIRDARARIFTLTVRLSSLPLDHHARVKMTKLLGPRYDPAGDRITLTVDRCPTRKQNHDYAHYLLAALFHESWKTEDWESEALEEDLERHYFERSTEAKVQTFMEGLADAARKCPADKSPIQPDAAVNLDELRTAWYNYRNNSTERLEDLENYGSAVKKLLGLDDEPRRENS